MGVAWDGVINDRRGGDGKGWGRQNWTGLRKRERIERKKGGNEEHELLTFFLHLQLIHKKYSFPFTHTKKRWMEPTLNFRQAKKHQDTDYHPNDSSLLVTSRTDWTLSFKVHLRLRIMRTPSKRKWTVRIDGYFFLFCVTMLCWRLFSPQVSLMWIYSHLWLCGDRGADRGVSRCVPRCSGSLHFTAHHFLITESTSSSSSVSSS